MVDRRWNLSEEPPEPIEVRRVERGDPRRELSTGVMHAFRVASGDDHGSPLAVRAARGLEPDARAAADHEDGLTGELGFPTHATRQPRRRTAPSHQGESLVHPRYVLGARTGLWAPV